MALSLGISHVALPTLSSGNGSHGSVCSNAALAASSETWHQKQFSNLNLRERPNSSGGRVPKSIFAEYVTNRGGGGEEGLGDNAQVGHRGSGLGHRGPPLREAPQRRDGKLWRRFPVPQGGPDDVSVPTESLKRGAVFRGTVSSMQTFGAFVKFGAFTDGLIHISNLSADYVKDVGDVLELGQEVLVRIMRVEESSGRISLGLVGKDEIEQRKPYISPRRKLLSSAKDDRASKASYPPPSRSRETLEGRNGPRFQRSYSTSYGEQDRGSRAPHASSRQPEAGRGGSRFQQRDSHRRPPFAIEEEERSGRRPPFAIEDEGRSGRRSPFAIEKEEGSGKKSPFALERQEGSGRRSPFAIEGNEGFGRRSPFALEEEERSSRRSPFAIEEREGSDRRSPFALEKQEGSGRRSPFAIEGKEGFGRRSPFAIEEGERSGRRSPFPIEEREGSGRRSPFSMEEEGTGWRSPLALEKEEGFGRRSPFTTEDEEGEVGRNAFASTGPVKAGEEDRRSRNSFTISRQREVREGDRLSGSPFVSSRGRSARGEERIVTKSFSLSELWEALEGKRRGNPSAPSGQRQDGDDDRMSRFSSTSSGPREFREEEGSSGLQSNDDTFFNGGGVSRAGRGVDRDEKAKPRARLVQMRSDSKVQDKSREEQVIRNQSMMRSWYECDCC